MSKTATQRREEKLAKELRALAVSNPTHLKSTWGKLLEGWSLEAIRRGRLLQQDSLKPLHFAVLEILKAECLLNQLRTLLGQPAPRTAYPRLWQGIHLGVGPHLCWLVNPGTSVRVCVGVMQ